VYNAQPITDFEKSSPNLFSIVLGVEQDEAEESMFEFPFAIAMYLDPMTSDSQVTVAIGGCPYVISQADISFDQIALMVSESLYKYIQVYDLHLVDHLELASGS
jgi:hypothetical protein